MTDTEKVELLKDYIKNEQFNKEPMVQVLISMLMKKGILSKEDYLELKKDFFDYIDRKTELFLDDIDKEINRSDGNDFS
ncbi:MAG: hypothetical protein ACI4YB_09955 [Oscillospiraceae bacterium]